MRQIILKFEVKQYNPTPTGLAFNMELKHIFESGLSNETLTDFLHEGLRTDKVVYKQITNLELSSSGIPEANFTYRYKEADSTYNENEFFIIHWVVNGIQMEIVLIIYNKI